VSPNVAASVRARLLNKAREEGWDFNLVLTRYALERLLYRLSVSDHRKHLLLKGALLFDLWFDVPHRPTRDADLLGFGSAEIPEIEALFRDLCAVDSEDGIRFLSETVRAAEIRKDARYAGIRVTLLGVLDSARCPVQVDVGYGDAVTPGPEPVDYPVLLPGLPAPRLHAYPRYTVVAEKLEALCALGMANSRMKDYFDLWVLARHADFDGETLAGDIRATFERRKTPLPEGLPFGLSDEFAVDSRKRAQWRGFVRKNRLDAVPLAEVITELRAFLEPPLNALTKQQPFVRAWPAGGPWA